MQQLNRRTLVQSIAAVTAAALPGTARAEFNERLIDDEIQREQIWEFFRSFYGTKDLCDSIAFNAHHPSVFLCSRLTAGVRL